MPWVWLMRIVVTGLTATGVSWTVSDIFNESQRTAQIEAGKTPTQDTTTSGTFFNWLQAATKLSRVILWILVVLLAGFIAYRYRGRFKK